MKMKGLPHGKRRRRSGMAASPLTCREYFVPHVKLSVPMNRETPSARTEQFA